jgi:chromate reductase
MNVLILSTSHRTNSSSLKVSKYLEDLFSKKGYTTKIIDFVNDDIPLIGKAELKPNHLTTFQSDLIGAWENSNLIIVVTPEYNWGLNANVINLFHQLGNNTFKHLFHNKIFGLVGVSAGRGGKFPAVDLMILISKLIAFLNQHSIISPKLLELHEVPKNLNENGELISQGNFVIAVNEFVDYTLMIAQKWQF